MKTTAVTALLFVLLLLSLGANVVFLTAKSHKQLAMDNDMETRRQLKETRRQLDSINHVLIYCRVDSSKNKFSNVPNVSRPFFKVGSVGFNGSIPLSLLKVQGTAIAELDNSTNYGDKFKIVGYRFTCVGRRTNGPKSVNVDGASFEPIKPLLVQLGLGDLILFDNIRAVGPNKRVILLDNTGGSLQ